MNSSSSKVESVVIRSLMSVDCTPEFTDEELDWAMDHPEQLWSALKREAQGLVKGGQMKDAVQAALTPWITLPPAAYFSTASLLREIGTAVMVSDSIRGIIGNARVETEGSVPLVRLAVSQLGETILSSSTDFWKKFCPRWSKEYLPSGQEIHLCNPSDALRAARVYTGQDDVYMPTTCPYVFRLFSELGFKQLTALYYPECEFVPSDSLVFRLTHPNL